MIRRPPRSTQSRSSAASDVYKRQALGGVELGLELHAFRFFLGQENLDQVFLLARRQEAQYVVAGQDLGGAARDQSVAGAHDRREQHATGQVDVLHVGVGEGRVLADLELYELYLLAPQRQQMHELVRRQLVHDEVQHRRGGAHRVLDAEQVEGGLVEGVVDPGHDLGHAELELGDLRDDDVVLVVAGDGDDHVGATDAGLLEDPDLGAVAEHEGVFAEQVGDEVVARLALLDEGDLVAKLHELSRGVQADLAAADDEHEHRSALLVRQGDLTGAHGVEERHADVPRRAHRVDADLREQLGAQGVVDPRHHTADAVLPLRDLRDDDVGVVAVGAGDERHGVVDPRPAQSVPVECAPHDELAGKIVAQQMEGLGALVDDGDVEALRHEIAGEAGADAPATCDQYVHWSPLTWSRAGSGL